MKRIFFLAGLLIFAPVLAFATFNDVSLTTDAVISVGGISLTVSGSSDVVESITVDTSSFSFTLSTGGDSSLKVVSSDRRVLSTNAGTQYITTNECSGSASTLGHTFSGLIPVTVSITPQTSTCGTSATSAVVSSSSSSSSSGGGGITPASLNNPTPPSTVAQNVGITVTPAAIVSVVAAPVTQTTPALSVSAVFIRVLSPKTSHADVKRLQQLLNSDPDTRIAESGVGSIGNETMYFGSLTTKAIQKFQVKYGVAAPGDVGYGNFGPKTRVRVQEVFGSEAPSIPVAPTSVTPTSSAASTVSAAFSRLLSPGASHADVKRLQQLLNSDPDTRIAESGVGSIGNETMYFGSLTTKAIQKFQVKYGVANPGDVGYGNFGPKTRVRVQEVFGK